MYISLKWIQEIIGVQKLTLHRLINRLTLAGFEIESITTKNYFENFDIILDISFTANRADVSNIKGLITEIIALFKSNFFLEIPPNIRPLILVDSQISKGVLNLDLSRNSTILGRNLLKSRSYKILNNYKLWQHNYSLWEWYLQRKSFGKILKNLNLHKVLDSNEGITLRNITSKKFEIKSSPYWIKNRLLLMGFNPVNNIIDTLNYLMIETGQVFFAYDLEILEDLMLTKDLVFITKSFVNIRFSNKN